MRRVLLLVALLALVGSACGVPSTQSAGAPPAASGLQTAKVSIFFANSSRGTACDDVFAVKRTVDMPRVARGALRQLLRGPSAAERAQGYGGWFSEGTAGMLNRVWIVDGVAHADFEDLRKVIPNASSSCGSTGLLAQLDRTLLQFPTVDRARYSIDGREVRFYEWLQLSVPS
jgi:spore germination protein GerM